MSEFREKTNDELKIKKDEISSEMMNLRFQVAKGVLENPARIRLLRKGIAKINTVVSEREKDNAKAGGE
ncbi:MAG: 50S ribosomal protein L29 [Nitrospinota bacterium]